MVFLVEGMFVTLEKCREGQGFSRYSAPTQRRICEQERTIEIMDLKLKAMAKELGKKKRGFVAWLRFLPVELSVEQLEPKSLLMFKLHKSSMRVMPNTICMFRLLKLPRLPKSPKVLN